MKDKQCAARTTSGRRCPERGWAVVRRTDRTKPEHDPARVAYYRVCESHCATSTVLHPDAEPCAESAS